MEFEITAGMYEQFKMHYLDPTNPLNELAQLKLYIQYELQKRLNEFPDLGIDEPNEDGSPTEIKIGQLTFAFHNGKLIKWLKQRGLAI